MRRIHSVPASSFLLRLLAVTVTLCLISCGDDSEAPAPEPITDTGASDVTEEVPDTADRDGSYFLLEVTYPSGNTVIYDEALLDSQISYGSQHIGSAVALTVEKKLSAPFAVINLNFGFVVGSNDYPVTINEVGIWPWTQASSELPPSMKIIATDGSGPQFNFSSWVDGASGQYAITRWGIGPGELIEGTVNGTLKNDGPLDATAEVKGTFRVFIPSSNL